MGTKIVEFVIGTVLKRCYAARPLIKVASSDDRARAREHVGVGVGLENLITTFNPLWLKSKHTKFDAVNIKSVGGVRSNARCGKRLKLKMADFLLIRRHKVQRVFCASGHDEGVQQISSGYAKLTPT